MTRVKPEPSEIKRAVLDAVAASRGHFLYESGHHGDMWLDLDALFVDARRARGWASALAHRATVCRPELVCGPLTGGAFVAQSLAAELGAGFVFAERFVSEMGAVQEALQAGKIRHIGFSSHSLDVALKGVTLSHFEVILFPFNFVNNDPADELVPLAREHDVGFIAMKPLAGGHLKDANLAKEHRRGFGHYQVPVAV